MMSQNQCSLRMPRSHDLDLKQKSNIQDVNNRSAMSCLRYSQSTDIDELVGGNEKFLTEDDSGSDIDEIVSRNNTKSNKLSDSKNVSVSLPDEEEMETTVTHAAFNYPKIEVEECEINHRIQSNIETMQMLFEEWAVTRDVSLRTDCTLEEQYQLGSMLGRGKFGYVYKVEPKPNNKNMEMLKYAAAKVITYRREEARQQSLEEIRILNKLRGHRHIMNILEAYQNEKVMPRRIIIVTEYLEGVELFEEVTKEEFMSEVEVINILRQILDGVNFIHSHNIIHRDLKPENIMFYGKDLLKIIDFGLAVEWDPNGTKPAPKTMVGTTIFVAPEVFRFEDQSSYTDMWSLGVITYNLLAGITPFEIPQSGDPTRQLSDNEIIQNIEKGFYNYEDEGFEGVDEQAKEFIDKLLLRNPRSRMSAQECLNHKWLHKDQIDSKPEVINRNISIKRMKNYVAINKWKKLGLAIHSINQFKGSITR